MSYYDESVHGRIDADPHTDRYFSQEGESEIGTADILLALDTLTERQRFVIECRFGLRPGMAGTRVSIREIASLMGVDRKTVYDHEQAGLAALRRTITPAKHPL